MTEKENPAEPLGDLVEKALLGLKKLQKSPNNRVADLWPALVGPKIARHTKPFGLKNRILFVRVDDSSLAFELSTRFKMGLLKRLNHALGEGQVANIYFKVGSL
jgi:predicted nucleic acid-binding Zn ribbon protein